MLQATPENLIFGRNMLLYIDFRPNYKEMSLRKQKLMNCNNKPENTKRMQHDYEFGH